MRMVRALKILIAVGSLFLALCMRGGTDTGNARVVGVVYNQDGSRAHNAEIVFVPSGFSPANGSCMRNVTTTDDTGGYRFDTLPPETYNVLGAGANGLFFEGLVKIGSDRVTVPACTLKTPSSVSGLVRVEPGNTPAVALIALLGTNTLGITDSGGRFQIDNIAAGHYTLRIIPIGISASMVDKPIIIEPGTNLQLPDTIKLKSSGIPLVSGLRATYDTLNQAVMLSWRPMNDSLIQGYELFRKNADLNLSLEQVPPRLLKDTFYRDTTCTPTGDGVTYEYRIWAKDTNDNHGLYGSGAQVHIVPRYYVTTTIQFAVSWLLPRHFFGRDPEGVDSIQVVATYSNPTRIIKKLEWYYDTQSSPIRVDAKSELTGADTIRIPLPQEEIHRIKFVATDNGGTTWTDSIQVASSFFPSIFAGEDTTVGPGASATLHGTVARSEIIKWEWNVNGAGFVATSGPDTTIAVPDSAISAYPCILRATNTHHFMAQDTMIIKIQP